MLLTIAMAMTTMMKMQTQITMNNGKNKAVGTTNDLEKLLQVVNAAIELGNY